MQVVDMKCSDWGQVTVTRSTGTECMQYVFFLPREQRLKRRRDSWTHLGFMVEKKPTTFVTSVARRLAQRLAPCNLTAGRSWVQSPGGRGLSCMSSLRLCPSAAPVSPPSGNMDCEVNIQSALVRTRIHPQGLCTGGGWVGGRGCWLGSGGAEGEVGGSNARVQFHCEFSETSHPTARS